MQRDPHDLWSQSVSVHWAIWDALAQELESGSLSRVSPNFTSALEAGDIGYIIARATKMVADLEPSFGDLEPAGSPDLPREAGWAARWGGGFYED